MSAEVVQLDTPEWVTTILDKFEKAEYFDEGNVAENIFAGSKEVKSPTDEEKKTAEAERLAFLFCPQHPGELSCWKTHFGPAVESGEFCNPDIVWLDEAVVRYWQKRMTEAKHPILRARYADLVWDLSKVVCGLKPSIEAARNAIDGYIAAGTLANTHSAMHASDRLQRGLKLALSISDQNRADQARDAIVDLFTRVNETWGWVTLFDIFEELSKIKLTLPQQTAMVAALESHITQIDKIPEGVDPAGTLHVAARLVKHYQRLNCQSEADRVVLASGRAAERRAETAEHTTANFWLDHVFRFYRINGLDLEAERVQLVARKRGEQAEGEAQSVSTEVDVPPDKLEEFVNGMTEGGLDNALNTIAGHFVPDLDMLRDRLKQFRKKYPMATMWPIAKMSEGQMVGKVGPVDTDPEGSLLNAVSDEISYSRLFLAKTFDRMRERYSVTPDHIISFLFESLAFTVKFRGIIRLGVEAYFAGDHPKSISLLVPQIENSLRFLLTLVGRPPNKPRRGNQPGMTEKTLTDILEHEPILKEKLGEAPHLYMLAFLADARGKNLRNRMSHGLMAAEDFNRAVSDRVLHTLLMLGTIRRKEPPKETPPQQNSVGGPT